MVQLQNFDISGKRYNNSFLGKGWVRSVVGNYKYFNCRRHILYFQASLLGERMRGHRLPGCQEIPSFVDWTVAVQKSSLTLPPGNKTIRSMSKQFSQTSSLYSTNRAVQILLIYSKNMHVHNFN